MAAKRLPFLDNVKFCLMFLVVLGHIFDLYINDSHIMKAAFFFIYTFHMPVFLFLSGLTHNPRKFSAHRVVSFFIIAALLLIVLSFSHALLYPEQPFVLSLFHISGIPWYLVALAVFEIIAAITADFTPAVLLAASLVIGTFSGYDASVGPYLCLSRIIVFLPFYLLGCICTTDLIERLAQKKWLRILSVTVLIAFAGICYWKTDMLYLFRPLLSGQNPFFVLRDGMVPQKYQWLLRLGLYGLTLIVGSAFLFAIPRKKLPLITYGGQNTLQVYFWHYPLILIFDAFDGYQKIGEMAGMTAAKISLVALAVVIMLITLIPVFRHPCSDLLKKRSGEKASICLKAENSL